MGPGACVEESRRHQRMVWRMLMSPLVCLSASQENLIRNAFKRRSCVDHDTTLRDIFFRCMQSHDQLRSLGLPPNSSSGLRTSRRFNVSISTSRTKTPSNKSIKRGKFLEPPQKKEIALR